MKKSKTIEANNAKEFDEKLNRVLEENASQDIRVFVSHVDAGCTIQAFYTAVVIYEEVGK